MEQIWKHPEGDPEKSCSTCKNNAGNRAISLHCMGAENSRKDNGDSHWDVAFHKNTDDKQTQDKGNKKMKPRSANSAIKVNNFASGDHEIAMLPPKCRPSKSVDFINLDKTDKIKHPDLTNNAGCLQTMHEYNNPNYCESESDSFALMSCPSLPKIGFEAEFNNSNQDFPRPIICPVLSCEKMIAMDSVLLHFYFDHSKILRKSINIGTPEKTLLKPSSITENTQCLKIFLLENMKSEHNGLTNKYKACNPLFLMAARMTSASVKTVQRAGNSSTNFLLNASTQTDYLVHNICRSCVSYSSLLQTDRLSEGNAVLANESFGKDEILMLWLCKLDSGMICYNISLMKEDHKQGHSYIGDAVYVRDKQDSSSILDRAECLIIPGVAANRLIDGSGKIIVIITVLNLS